MILNDIEGFDFEFHKNILKILRTLMLSVSLINKSFTILFIWQIFGHQV